MSQLVQVKFSHTRYRALGPELIPVYRQSARRWPEVNHATDLAVGCHYFPPVCGYLRSFHQMALPVNGSTHLIPAYYLFIESERMKGWVGLVGWPVADGLPTLVVTHQLQVERRTGKVRRPETDILPLCHATNILYWNHTTNVYENTYTNCKLSGCRHCIIGRCAQCLRTRPLFLSDLKKTRFYVFFNFSQTALWISMNTAFFILCQKHKRSLAEV